MRTRHGQRGITLISWLAILLVVGFFALFAMAVVPAYFNYWNLVSIAEGVYSDRALRDASRQEIRSKINTRMRINDVDDVGYDAIQIVSSGNQSLILDINYEVRENLVGNIDVVVSFERRIGS